MMTRSMPGAAGDLTDEHPDIWKAYSALGKAMADSGPLGPPRAVTAKTWIEDIEQSRDGLARRVRGRSARRDPLSRAS